MSVHNTETIVIYLITTTYKYLAKGDFMRSKKLISLLLCAVAIVSIFSGCNNDDKPVTLNVRIKFTGGTELEEYEDDINAKLEELQKPYRLDFSTVSFSEYIDGNGNFTNYSKLIDDFDVFYIDNASVIESTSVQGIPQLLENECLYSLEDLWTEEQYEDVKKEYLIDENLDSGRYNGKLYITPTSFGVIIPFSTDGGFAIDKKLFEKANLTEDDYMVDITQADALFQKLYEANNNVAIFSYGDKAYESSIYLLKSFIPKVIVLQCNKYKYPVSGVGVTKEDPPRVFNLFSDPYMVEFIKAMARYKNAGYIKQTVSNSKMNCSIASTSKNHIVAFDTMYITPSPTGTYGYYAPDNMQETVLTGMAISSKTQHKEEAAQLLYDLVCDYEVKKLFGEYDINSKCTKALCEGTEILMRADYYYPADENGDRVTPYLETVEIAKPYNNIAYFDLTGLEDKVEAVDNYIIEICESFFESGGVLADENGKLTDESVEKGMAEIAQHLEELGIQEIIDRISEQV